MDQQQKPTGTSGDALAGGEVAPARDKLTVKRFEEWLRGAQPGARLVYHTGFYAGDAGEELNLRLNAERVRGMVYLHVRRRTDLRGYDYIAARTTRSIADGRPRPNFAATMAEQARAWAAKGGHQTRKGQQ